MLIEFKGKMSSVKDQRGARVLVIRDENGVEEQACAGDFLVFNDRVFTVTQKNIFEEYPELLRPSFLGATGVLHFDRGDYVK